MIVKDFDDMRIGTIPLSKLYYGHDLIWKREDGDSDTLIITTVSTDIFTIPSINATSITGTVDFGDGESSEYNNVSIIHNYPYFNNWKIKIKAPFTSMKSSAFYNNSKINSVILPKGVTNISGWAFEYCSSLTSITIPNSVTSIGVRAFYNCRNLSSITIPNSVTSIEEGAFVLCGGLTSIIIPNSVTSIKSSTFYYCFSLTSIIIPDSVTIIEERAFCDCSSLTSITIPNSVTIIGVMAFYDCTSLTSITIPPSVKSIGTSAFAATKLTSVTIASDCTYDSNSFPSGCVINRY